MAALFLSAAFSFSPPVPCCALITPLINTLCFPLLLCQRVLLCLRPVPYPVICSFVPATLSRCLTLPWTYWIAFPISDPAFLDYVFRITPLSYLLRPVSVLVPDFACEISVVPLINFPFRIPLWVPLHAKIGRASCRESA